MEEDESNLVIQINQTNPTSSLKRLDKDVIEPKRSKRQRIDSDSVDLDDFDYDCLDQIDERIVPDSVPFVRYRRVLKNIPDIPYVPLSSSDGSRIYLRLFPDENIIQQDEEIESERRRLNKNAFKNLLGINFQDLRREAHSLKSKLSEDIGRLSAIENVPKKKSKPKRLWVDKYRPKSYMDLISEESVNNDLLHWIKIWDKIVFGKDYLAKHQAIKEKYSSLDAKEREKNKFIKISQVVDDGYDEVGRPKQKVVLLHGPAGLGKTTAAHIIAKQAGYNVVEMNASDDRSLDIFKKVLESTTESRSEMFQNGRPNCLVIDEIDGSPAGTVEVLVSLIQGKSKEKGKNKNKKILRRPIICICNDLFAPALKNLRAVALLIQFRPASVQTIVERIQEISLKEKLHLGLGTLQIIVEKSECDIRSCLSTLQFIKNNFKFSDNFLEQIGDSDKTKGVFSVWEEIFTIKNQKTYYDKADPSRTDIRFAKILKIAQNFGDYEQLHSGVFENCLNSQFRDSYMETVVDGLDWSIWFDQVHLKINSLQNYTFYGFLPIYFVVSHFLYASKSKFPIQFPKASSKSYQLSTRFNNTFKSQLIETPPKVGRFINMMDTVLDIFPLIIPIVQPNSIRAVSSQIWSTKEQETAKNVVNIMIEYNLTFVQDKQNEGAYNMLFEPDIEELVRFSCEDSLSRPKYSYVIKSMIAREIMMEKIRLNIPTNLNEAEGDIIKKTTNKSTLKNKTETDKVPAANFPSKGLMPYELNRLPTTTKKDIFGRAIVQKPLTEAEKVIEEKKKRIRPIVYYVYQEGHSNALRTNLKLKDFL